MQWKFAKVFEKYKRFGVRSLKSTRVSKVPFTYNIVWKPAIKNNINYHLPVIYFYMDKNTASRIKDLVIKNIHRRILLFCCWPERHSMFLSRVCRESITTNSFKSLMEAGGTGLKTSWFLWILMTLKIYFVHGRTYESVLWETGLKLLRY